ncbi:MAG: ABC transporter ATP-binding protein [Chloroflexi bacterium]|nr:ABC transporter ATP-binding protein [Chloroflexota bacterium]
MMHGFGGGGGGRGMLHHYQDTDGAFFDPKVAKRLVGYLQPHWHRMGLAALFMLASTATKLVTPYLTKQIIDVYIANSDLHGLLLISLIAAAVYVVEFYSNWKESYLLSWVGQRILNKMRVQLFEHYQRLSLSFYSKIETGTLISRVLSDVGVLNELISSGFINMISDVLFLVGTVVVMLTISWRLALLTFAVLPLMVLATYLFSRKAKGAYRQTRVAVGELTGDLAENLSNMRVVQAFVQEDSTHKHFETLNRTNREVNIRAMMLSFIFMPTADVLNVLATTIVLWFGGRWAAADELTLGVVVAFVTYVTRFFQPIQDLSQIYTTFQAAMAGGERVFDLLDTPPSVQDAPDAIPMPTIEGHIELCNVRFEYEPGVPVLDDVSLDVTPGQTIALVGPTGAGKTTITSLCCRFYDVTEGCIKVDGHDLRDVQVRSLRAQMGMVPQEPFLLQATIAENIRFSRPDASEEEVREAARLANADEFISKLPAGYDTPVMEGSSNLSQGQRQLICFARAILSQPRILILDEATSSVDTRTEVLIQDALRNLLKGRTSLVVAHRLSTIREADQICFIDQGKIQERGTHEELLALGGRYAALYRQQFAQAE